MLSRILVELWSDLILLDEDKIDGRSSSLCKRCIVRLGDVKKYLL